MLKNKFKEFCYQAKIDSQKTKLDSVILLMFFEITFNSKEGLTVSEINQLLENVHLPLYNRTYLKRDLSKDRRVTKLSKSDRYKLTYTTIEKLDSQFAHLKNEDTDIKVRVNIHSTPYLTENDLEGSQKMAQLYLIIYCWENSVRKFIQDTLKTKIGLDWWEKTKNKELHNKYEDRKLKETRHNWISPRGTENPLFYLDWGDLVKIIRKHELLFSEKIPDIKFVELRLEELERLRNIIAHNGLVPIENDIDRIIVHFNDWCSQIVKS